MRQRVHTKNKQHYLIRQKVHLKVLNFNSQIQMNNFGKLNQAQIKPTHIFRVLKMCVGLTHIFRVLYEGPLRIKQQQIEMLLR